jgi:hypothetical protein
MKHIKIFEAEVTKSFTDWLKNPKRPKEDEWKEVEYTYSIPISKKISLVDSGDFSTLELLYFIKDEHVQDLFQIIARENEISVHDLKRSDDLDEMLENYLKGEFGSTDTYWSKFLDEYFMIEDYIDSDDDYDYIIKSFNSIDKSFSNDEAWFRVNDVEFVYPQDVRADTGRVSDSNIYIKITTSRELRDEEEFGWIKEYINEITSNLEHELNSDARKIVKRNSNYNLKFYVEYFLSNNGDIRIVKNWEPKLVQTKIL